jgi:hypothetical protein
MKQLFINILILLFFSNSLFSQSLNQWINPNQYYYKIGVVNDGIIRITNSQLINAGIPISSFAPDNIQIFHKGNEIPIHISTTSGAINYIEFYGEKNTGWFDIELYTKPSAQTNPHFSQINDTAAYFLTWNNQTNNKRYNESAYNASGQDVLYGISKALIQYANAFQIGETFPEYNETKGWFGSLLSLGNTQNKTLTLPAFYDNNSNIIIETAVISYNDAAAMGANHHLRITLPDASIFDTIFYGKRAIKKTFSINTANLSESNTISYSSVDDLGTTVDKMAVSFIYTHYPASFNIAPNTQQTFLVNNSSQNQLITISGLSESMPPVILDTANHVMPVPQFNGTNWQISLPPSPKNHYLVVQNGTINGSYVHFANTSLPTNLTSDYIIITHPKLINGANSYATYRNANVVSIDAIYNHFAHGINKHPIAIRNFFRYYYSINGELPKYVLLLGKSIQINNSRNNTTYFNRNLIPSIGYPPSDNLLAAKITSENHSPELALSRLSVETNEQINQYLSKVQELENQPVAEWMKQFIHFGGGNNESEQILFKSYIENYRSIIEDTLMGAKVSTFLKNSSDPIQITSSDSIKSLINNGTSMLTFFGHGYTGGFDQDIDEPESYNNQGRYPLMLANSCYSGNIHTTSTSSASENWVLIPNKGAIAFLASVSEGYPSLLNKFSQDLYKNLAYKNYGESIGEIVKNAAIYHLGVASSNLDSATALDFTLHGDPAIVLNQFDKPDILLKNELVSIDPREVTTAIDSFAIKILVRNIGKAINSEIGYQIEHIFPNGKDTAYYKTKQNLYYQDSITFWIPINRQIGAGLNVFIITADYLSQHDELNELNNSITIPVNIKSSSVIPVFPYPYGINNKDTIVLRASTGDPFIKQVFTKFQIDTTATFNSPFKQEIEQYFNGGVIEWNTNIIGRQNQTYYWRIGIKNEEDEWEYQNRSFTQKANEKGWIQSDFEQIAENSLQFIELRNNNLSFITAAKQLVCQNVGLDRPFQHSYNDVYYSLLGSRTNAACGIDSAFVVVVFDSLNFQAWQTNRGDYGQINYPQCPTFSYPHFLFVYSTESNTSLDNMVNFIEEIVPHGHYILSYSYVDSRFESWENRHFEAFENLGASIIRGVPNLYPYIFFTQKGFPEKTREVVGSNTQDLINLTVNLKDNFDYGYIATDWIGPSKSWNSLSWFFNDQILQPEDSLHINIFGKGPNIENELLQQQINILNTPIDLSSINSDTYPYLKIEIFTQDKVSKSPAYPDELYINYEPQSDIAISPGDYFEYPKDSLQEGDDLLLKLAFKNTSDILSDSIELKYRITDLGNQTIQNKSSSIKPLNEFQYITDSILFSTEGLAGYHNLWIEYGQNATDDFYTFNNLGNLSFYVYGDQTNPLLDVTFDGRHILNGEIVSSEPVINISLKDENPYLSLNDTSLFAIYLSRVGSDLEQRVYITPGIENGTIMWQPAEQEKKASITYMPQFPEDGIYQLRVQARDASNNLSGQNDYKIEFEIINESTITNVFNYPNPFSTKTRFAFTLTGNQIPDDFRIDIYTISGKKVKSIDPAELGPIYIGRNVTEYYWDGRDDFGDRLANGVYIYKVTVKMDGEPIKMRSTSADKFFNKGWGKMYLMR